MKTVYRLPPCPSFDIESTESWLCDMSRKGLHLSGEGFFAGVAIFDRGEPADIRYRLEAAPEDTGILSANGGQPDPDAVALNAEYGWEFISSHDQFYIYRTTDPNAPELHTDPRVQALALKKVRSRLRSNFVTLALWLLIYPLVQMRGGWLRAAISLGTPLFVLTVLILIWTVGRAAIRAVRLSRLHRRLSSGTELDHKKDWDSSSALYRMSSILHTICVIVWGICMLAGWANDVEGKGEIITSEIVSEVPFATFADLMPEGEYEFQNYGWLNTSKIGSRIFAPSIIDWDETAKVRTANGTYSGGLMINYCELTSEWLAKELARELYNHDRFNSIHRRITPLEAPVIAADSLVCYSNEIHNPTAIIRIGRKVARISMYQTGSLEVSFEDWLPIFADSLR